MWAAGLSKQGAAQFNCSAFGHPCPFSNQGLGLNIRERSSVRSLVLGSTGCPGPFDLPTRTPLMPMESNILGTVATPQLAWWV